MKKLFGLGEELEMILASNEIFHYIFKDIGIFADEDGRRMWYVVVIHKSVEEYIPLDLFTEWLGSCELYPTYDSEFVKQAKEKLGNQK